MRSYTILLLVFAFQSISISVKSQSFSIVDSLVLEKKYEEASLACEELVFRHREDSEVMAELLLMKCKFLEQTGKYAQIPPLLARLDGIRLNDTLKAKVYLEKGLGYYLSDNFEMAEKSVLPVFNIEYVPKDVLVSGAILYAMALGESGKWTEAGAFLSNFIHNDLQAEEKLKQELMYQVATLYSEEKIPEMKSIRKAKVLSLIVPGLGQAYNGDYGKGLLNLLLVSGSGTWITWNVLNSTYLTAATAGVYVFLYFYFGGANQSSWLVPAKNNKKKILFNNDLRPALSHLGERMLRQ